jgi:hypothetical protein
MAKKNFKTGLDNLMSVTGIQKQEIDSEEFDENIELSEEIKQIFAAKIARLKEELVLWRSGKLTHEIFLKGLEENDLEYDPETDRFSIK